MGEGGSYSAIPTHSALKEEATNSDVRAMAPRKHQPVLFGQHTIDILSCHAWSCPCYSSLRVHFKVLVVAQVDQDRIVTYAPRSPGMATRTNCDATVILNGQLHGSHNVILATCLYHGQGIPLRATVVEDAAHTGVFIGVSISCLAPNNLHDVLFEFYVRDMGSRTY